MTPRDSPQSDATVSTIICHLTAIVEYTDHSALPVLHCAKNSCFEHCTLLIASKYTENDQ